MQAPQQNSLAGTAVSSHVNPLATTIIAALLQQAISSTSVNANPSALTQIEYNRLFWVMFISGNISRCQGCGGKIERASDGKPLPPPQDLVVQHKEQVLFQNPKTGNFQLSHDHRNVYYHPRLTCIQAKFPSFSAVHHIQAATEVITRLTALHKSYLAKEFTVQFVQT